MGSIFCMAYINTDIKLIEPLLAPFANFAILTLYFAVFEGSYLPILKSNLYAANAALTIIRYPLHFLLRKENTEQINRSISWVVLFYICSKYINSLLNIPVGRVEPTIEVSRTSRPSLIKTNLVRTLRFLAVNFFAIPIKIISAIKDTTNKITDSILQSNFIQNYKFFLTLALSLFISNYRLPIIAAIAINILDLKQIEKLSLKNIMRGLTYGAIIAPYVLVGLKPDLTAIAFSKFTLRQLLSFDTGNKLATNIFSMALSYVVVILYNRKALKQLFSQGEQAEAIFRIVSRGLITATNIHPMLAITSQAFLLTYNRNNVNNALIKIRDNELTGGVQPDQANTPVQGTGNRAHREIKAN